MSAIYDQMGNVIGDDAGEETAVVDPSQIGYFQQKILDFQNTLYDVDLTAWTLEAMMEGASAEDQDLIQTQLAEYDSRKAAMKFTAEAFNMIANGVNAVGGSMSTLDIPSGLGLAPFAIPVGALAAALSATAFIAWAINWMLSSKNLIYEIASKMTDPAARDKALALAADLELKKNENSFGSVVSKLSGLITIVLIAGIGYAVFNQIESKK